MSGQFRDLDANAVVVWLTVGRCAVVALAGGREAVCSPASTGVDSVFQLSSMILIFFMTFV